MQKILKKKILGDKWWATIFDHRLEFCDNEYESLSSVSSRLRKQKYDRDLEVDNWSETSSQAEERKYEEKNLKAYNKYMGFVELENEENKDDDEKVTKKPKRPKRNKDAPIAMTSTKRRASISSTGSFSSDKGGSSKSSTPKGAHSKQNSLSRQSSIKSQKSFS